jgi:hypothetical protein
MSTYGRERTPKRTLNLRWNSVSRFRARTAEIDLSRLIHGEHLPQLIVHEHRHRTIDVGTLKLRNAWVDPCDELHRAPVVALDLQDSVLDHRLGPHVIAAELRRSADDMRAEGDRNAGDLVVVGAHVHVTRADEGAAEGRVDGPRHQRLAADHGDVLAGHTSRSASRRDDADRVHMSFIEEDP